MEVLEGNVKFRGKEFIESIGGTARLDALRKTDEDAISGDFCARQFFGPRLAPGSLSGCAECRLGGFPRRECHAAATRHCFWVSILFSNT
jgi:hypothetical protein